MFRGVPGFLAGVPGCPGFFTLFRVFRGVPGCSGVPCSGVPVFRHAVYDVMTQIDPEGLERRKVGQKKRHRGPTGTFTSLVRYLLVLFFTRSRRRHDHCFASVRFTYNMRASE